ncbi:MAG: hypothetical protein HYX75_11290 [Acidobacteria bacterium]|nr:hypothetical protein [Acidobacteriota bacterium]
MRGTAALCFLATGILATLTVYLPMKNRSDLQRKEFNASIAAVKAGESLTAARLWTRKITHARRLAPSIARSVDLAPTTGPEATASTFADAFAPFVPFPYAAILVFDDAGDVVARVRATGLESTISEAETVGIDEAGLAQSALVHFDNDRRLIRMYEPVFRDGKRRGFLCFEIEALPDADWFLTTFNRILIAPTSTPQLVNTFYRPDGLLQGIPTAAWEIDDTDQKLYLCRKIPVTWFGTGADDSMPLLAAMSIIVVGTGAGYLMARRHQHD